MLTGRLALAVLLALVLAPTAAQACPHCRIEARAAVLADRPAETALLVFAPLLVVGAAGALLYTSDRHDPDA
ncbi:MAG TPA: hypothetical protein VGB53_15910 [Rubricoccaceae bacterium]|jgi:hypothetical protein